MSQYWSDFVSGLDPYSPGEQPDLTDIIKLNTNENPYGPSPKALQAVEALLNQDLRLYPPPGADSLKHTIAAYYQLTPANVFVGNSSDEVLAHVFNGLLRHSKPLLFPDITYSFYPSYCRLFDLPYQEIALDRDFMVDVENYPKKNGGVIIPNPNAPTGIDLGRKSIRRLLERQSDQVVIVDEAYVDFGADTAAIFIEEYPNLLVTRSLSKSHALAGLRVGYALGHVDLIEGMHRVKDSFNSYPVDRLASAGAIAAIQDQDYLDRIRVETGRNRGRLTSGLTALGFSVLPSAANFVFVHHKRIAATTLNEELRKMNILVRHFARPDRIEGYLRITVGSEASINQLLDKLQIIFARQ